jgi:hypothetical protein
VSSSEHRWSRNRRVGSALGDALGSVLGSTRCRAGGTAGSELGELGSALGDALGVEPSLGVGAEHRWERNWRRTRFSARKHSVSSSRHRRACRRSKMCLSLSLFPPCSQRIDFDPTTQPCSDAAPPLYIIPSADRLRLLSQLTSDHNTALLGRSTTFVYIIPLRRGSTVRFVHWRIWQRQNGNNLRASSNRTDVLCFVHGPRCTKTSATAQYVGLAPLSYSESVWSENPGTHSVQYVFRRKHAKL